MSRVVAAPGPEAVVLPYGFTLAGLDQVAGMSARGSLRRSPPHAEKVDLARFAILEHLYQCRQHVDTGEVFHSCNLVRVGQQAIDEHVQQQDMLYRTAVDDDVCASPEEPVVEALAFRQIWSLLDVAHQQALLALAQHQDYEIAAETSGVAYHLMVMQVYEARRTFLAHWHDTIRSPSTPGSRQGGAMGAYGSNCHRAGTASRRVRAPLRSARTWRALPAPASRPGGDVQPIVCPGQHTEDGQA
ncbi:hypothetical protein [Phytohabitans rumicis]|nr:hypothetical protein [Phytohabitans rumicis]